MDVVAQVLASPRGRHFTALVGYACSTDERADHGRVRERADVHEILAAVDVAAVAGLTELDMLDALALTADFAWYWQPPDEEDVWFADPAVVALLAPLARAALATPHTRWWPEPVTLHEQRLVEKLHDQYGWSAGPGVNMSGRGGRDRLREWREHTLSMEAQFREYDPDRQVSGEWWSTPEPSGIPSTSRSRDCVGAVELLLEEDDCSASLRARVWPVHVTGTPRVYEITGPAAWARLVESYPLSVPASRRSDRYDTTGEHHHWYLPDWLAAADDYDAVHLSVQGYLTTAGTAVPLASRTGATVLAGWDPDATFWLHPDYIHVDGDYTEWCRTPGTDWTPRTAQHET